MSTETGKPWDCGDSDQGGGVDKKTITQHCQEVNRRRWTKEDLKLMGLRRTVELERQEPPAILWNKLYQRGRN